MKKDDLPDEYVPTSLRPEKPEPRDHVEYAVGYEEKPGSYGMTDGPSPSLQEMLEVVPDEPRKWPCVVRFNKDGTDEILYRWDWKKGCWKRGSSGGPNYR